jgi:hypothetical protein
VTTSPYASPLPVSKHARVYAELLRTACAVLAVALNTATLIVVLR